MSREPMMMPCFERGGWLRRRSLPWLVAGLLLAPAAAFGENEVSPRSMEAVSKAPPPLPKSKRSLQAKTAKSATQDKALPKLLPTPSAVTVVPTMRREPATERLAEKTITGQHRPYIEVSALGVLIGDYQIQPRLVLGTDNRLDDSNTRERALRDDLDAMESRKRGEVHEDSISRWLRTRGQNGIPGIDPGFQVAYAIQRVLRGGIRLPPMLEYAPAPPAAYSQSDKR